MWYTKSIIEKRGKEMRYADCHIHSVHSFDSDGSASVQNIISSASEKGIFFAAITDHFDVNNKYDKQFPVYEPEIPFRDIKAIIAEHTGEPAVSYGIELGQAHQYPDDAREYLCAYRPSTVVGSVHNTLGDTDFYYMDYSRLTDDDLRAAWNKYVGELLAMANFDGIDILAHPLYPYRYISKAADFDISYSFDSFAAIFETLVKRNICLECNTALFADKDAKKERFDAEKRIFEIYRECGGELVTLGSDAHRPSDIGRAFDTAAAFLFEIGFKELAFVKDKSIETYKIEL